ncbi:unnamed protein product [Rotaria magnacalcarata]|uniref:Uncharacterized protein n=1 Tax=Rotaria magnacalcarata TaxID=392030 RepID=A0A816LYB5_9BILA|nr:unnamed protein product [Rotaria magnacalcarata]CAF1965655.1 unnamed protein product [Rotaria magnacalcarata]
MSKSNYSSQRSHHQSSRSYHSSSHRSPSHQPHENYPSFHVHSLDYEVVFVNNEISTNTINKLLHHVTIYKQYSSDTESERANNQLSLIQIHSMPIKPPSFVMLIELKRLPDQNSQKYENILQLFEIIFRAGNEIYSWGNMEKEIEPAKELFTWPIPAELIDIQLHFPAWYDWARTQCGVQSLSHRNDKINDNESIQQHHQQSSCYCHPPSPYRINELWSLQNARKYACNLFLDKSCTLSHWSSSLTSNHSSLSHVTRMNMIHYATHDVMAVTLLIRPIAERWTFDQIKIKLRKMNETFVAFHSSKLPPLTTSKNQKNQKKIKNINLQTLTTLLRSNDPDVEDISSDDEIYLNQLNEPSKIEHKPLPIEHEPLQIEHEPLQIQQELLHVEQELLHVEQELLHVEQEPLQSQHQANRRKRRSTQWRKRQNKKHNTFRKQYRYRHSIIRRVYNRFPMYLIRKILRLYNVCYTHVKINDDNDLIIGLKNRTSQNEAENNLSTSIFGKRSYYHYRQLYR